MPRQVNVLWSHERRLILAFGPTFTTVPEPPGLRLTLLGFMALLLSFKLPIRSGKENKDIYNPGG